MNHEWLGNTIIVPRRISLKARSLQSQGFDNFEDWNFYHNNLYIGRYNKFTGAASSKWMNRFNLRNYSRDESLILYELTLRNNSVLLNALSELEGQNLGCYCQQSLRCHGEILVDLFKQRFGVPDIVPAGGKFTTMFDTSADWWKKNALEKEHLASILESRYGYR